MTPNAIPRTGTLAPTQPSIQSERQFRSATISQREERFVTTTRNAIGHDIPSMNGGLRRAAALQGETIMFSDTAFWRLVWKEYRVQRPLWLTLLIVTPVLQVALLALNWAIDGFRPLHWTDGLKLGLQGIGFAASAVYVLGCGATLFSVEHETGTFDFQRVLPANQPRAFCATVSFALV